MDETYAIRRAETRDLEAICAFEPDAAGDSQRRSFIERSIAAGNGYVIETGMQVTGYAVLEYTFYEQGFISLVHIHADHRRLGIGSSLVQHLESICRTHKLFTSTNLSNRSMQALLSKRGYKLSGIIHNLDEDDPELVYVKFLKPDEA